MDRLDQLFARSLREIEAHAGELAQTVAGGFLINEAAQLLAALRLWAQAQYRSDRAVREILDAVDEVSLMSLVDDLGASGDRDSQAAMGTLAAAVKLPREHLSAIASYAFRAL